MDVHFVGRCQIYTGSMPSISLVSKFDFIAPCYHDGLIPYLRTVSTLFSN